MTDSTVHHNLVGIIHAIGISLAIVFELMLNPVASRNMLTDAAICTSQHQAQLIRSPNYCVAHAIPQPEMYRRD